MSEEYIKVFVANGQLEADMVRLMLEASGVQVITRRESAGAVYGLTVGSLGEVHLVVPESQFEEATRLIDAMQKGELETDTDLEDLFEGENPEDDSSDG